MSQGLPADSYRIIQVCCKGNNTFFTFSFTRFPHSSPSFSIARVFSAACENISTLLFVKTFLLCCLWKHFYFVVFENISTLLMGRTFLICCLWEHFYSVVCDNISTLLFVITFLLCCLWDNFYSVDCECIFLLNCWTFLKRYLLWNRVLRGNMKY